MRSLIISLIIVILIATIGLGWMFDNIYEQIIPMEKFRLKWRFTEEKYYKLPEIHLEQLKPLNEKASEFIWDFISSSGMHNETPFKEDFFKTIDVVYPKNRTTG